MTSIYLYKRSNTDFSSWRYEISNIERLDISKNTPVSAMPLPMEDSSENILVKMEGNSEVVQISWRIPEEAVARVKKKTTAESTAIIQGTADDDAKYEWAGSGSGAFGWESSNPVNTTTGTATRSGADVVNILMQEFEGRDIGDEYYLSIPQMSAREGWVSQLSAQITGDSPVVWTMSLTFQTGRVISMYDADAPSEPRSVVFVPCDSSGKVSGEGGYSAPDTKLRVRWVVPVESGGSSIAKYTVYHRTSNSSWIKKAETASNVYEYIVATGVSGEQNFVFIKASNTDAVGMKSDEKNAEYP